MNFTHPWEPWGRPEAYTVIRRYWAPWCEVFPSKSGDCWKNCNSLHLRHPLFKGAKVMGQWVTQLLRGRLWPPMELVPFYLSMDCCKKQQDNLDVKTLILKLKRVSVTLSLLHVKTEHLTSLSHEWNKTVMLTSQEKTAIVRHWPLVTSAVFFEKCFRIFKIAQGRRLRHLFPL